MRRASEKIGTAYSYRSARQWLMIVQHSGNISAHEKIEASRRGKKGRKPSRDKNEGTNRSGEGGGKPAL